MTKAIYSLCDRESITKFANQVKNLQLVIHLKSATEGFWLDTGSLRIAKGDKSVVIDTNGYTYCEDEESNSFFATIGLDTDLEYIKQIFPDWDFNLDLDDIFDSETVAELVIEGGNLSESILTGMTLNKGEKFINVKQW